MNELLTECMGIVGKICVIILMISFTTVLIWLMTLLKKDCTDGW